MSITTNFKNRMAEVSKQYKIASLIKTDNLTTHSPLESENYGNKALTWLAPSGGKISTTNITFNDIPSGARADAIVLKTDKAWIDADALDNIDARYKDFYEVFTAIKSGSNEVAGVGWFVGTARNYPYLLFDVELSPAFSTLNVTVADGAGSTFGLNDWYEALWSAQQAGWLATVTTQSSVRRVVFGSNNGIEKIMAVRHMMYFNECAYIKQKQSTATADLNAFKIAYDLDDYKNEELDFTKKGTIVTSIERDYIKEV